LSDNTESAVRTEVEALHEFFVGWFSGALNASVFDTEFLPRFAPDFHIVPPAGTLMNLGQITEAIRSARDTNAEFRIAIRNVTVRAQFDGHILATYEEWQRNALASQPRDNGRIATVILRDTRPLQWLHVHETWLPNDVMAAGPYDF